MFIPFFSRPSDERKHLWRRKGGGRGGGGFRGSGSKSTGHSSGKSSVVTSSGARVPATRYGKGDGTPTVIPAGSPFAGRTVGGGTRNDVYGARIYGAYYYGHSSAYQSSNATSAPRNATSQTTRGTAGRDLPFHYWPIAFGGAAAAGAGAASLAYLYTDEYGSPTNDSRPGGQQRVATFVSKDTDPVQTFRLLADNATVVSLVEVIADQCEGSLSTKDRVDAVPVEDYHGASADTPPRPEQVIQYYRASTVALALDSYKGSEDEEFVNWTGAMGGRKLVDCLNKTIGEAVPLVDGGAPMSLASSSPLVLAAFIGAMVHVFSYF